MSIPLEIDDGELFDDICNALPDNRWSENPYGLPIESNNLWIDWTRFSEQVKHHTRYVFFRVPQETKDPYWVEPDYILDDLGEFVRDLSLVRTIPKGTNFIRGRPTKENEHFTSAKKLGTPLIKNAKYSNRMSPAGIPMFYGAYDEKTVKAEIYNNDPKSEYKYVTLATWETLEAFKVLDLTELPPVPSLFGEKSGLRHSIFFLNAFAEDVSKEVDKEKREHIEYVPTQVVTEYFRHVFLDEEKDHIKGIIYWSSRIEDGKSCVLFFENKNCKQDDDVDNHLTEKWLMMMSPSVKKSKAQNLIATKRSKNIDVDVVTNQ